MSQLLPIVLLLESRASMKVRPVLQKASVPASYKTDFKAQLTINNGMGLMSSINLFKT